MRYNDGAQSDTSQALRMALLNNADIGHHSELQHVRQGPSYDTSFLAMGMSCKASSQTQQLEINERRRKNL